MPPSRSEQPANHLPQPGPEWLQALADSTLASCFPELETYAPKVMVVRSSKAFMSLVWESGRCSLEVDSELLDAPQEVLIGGLAHEFGHLAHDHVRGFAVTDMETPSLRLVQATMNRLCYRIGSHLQNWSMIRMSTLGEESTVRLNVLSLVFRAGLRFTMKEEQAATNEVLRRGLGAEYVSFFRYIEQRGAECWFAAGMTLEELTEAVRSESRKNR